MCIYIYISISMYQSIYLYILYILCIYIYIYIYRESEKEIVGGNWKKCLQSRALEKFFTVEDDSLLKYTFTPWNIRARKLISNKVLGQVNSKPL